MKKKPARRYLVGYPEVKGAEHELWGNALKGDPNCAYAMTAAEVRRYIKTDFVDHGVRPVAFEVLPADGFE